MKDKDHLVNHLMLRCSVKHNKGCMKIQPYIHVRNTGKTGLSYLKIV